MRTESSLSQRSQNYLALAKPRVVMMILTVTTLGFYMGTTGTLNWLDLLHVNLGMALAAGGTLALNQYIERHHDARMHRTRHRPLPEARLHPSQALVFGLILMVSGISYLSLIVHPLAGLVTLMTTSSYLFLYTPLKRTTPLCCVVGALPGALPPVTGWVAARGTLGPEVWSIFAILFLWQLPHAWAIAWLYQEDYARAGFRLLPTGDPDHHRISQYIIVSCLALLLASVLPTWVGLTGLTAFIAIIVLALLLLIFGIAAAISRTHTAIQRLVWASIIYPPVACFVMALDKVPNLTF